MGQLRQLAGQTVIYGTSSVLGRALNFLLVPLYTAVLGLAEYGMVTDLYAYVAFLNILYTYGFETAYFRFATGSKEPLKYYHLAQSSIIFSSIFFSAVLILFSGQLSSLLQYPGKGDYIIWLAFILAIDAIVAVPFARLRLEGKAYRFAFLKLLNISMNMGLNLFFLVFCPWWLEMNPSSWIADIYNPNLGVGYVFLSNLLANGLYLIFFLGYFLRLKLRLSRDWVAMLIYALPLMIMGFAGVTNEMFSRALLKYLLPEGFYPQYTNQEVLGIFGACYKLSLFMTLAVQAFRYAFEPFFFSNSVDKKSPELFAKVMHGFIIFGSFSWLFISLFLPEIAPIFLRKEDYLTGLGVVPWLLGGGLFLGIYFNLSLWYKLTDKTAYGAWISITGAVITVVFNVMLIPVIGYMGSAMTTFLSYFLMSAISYYFGQKHYPIPYFTYKGLFYITLAGGSILAFYFWGIDSAYKYFIATGLVAIYGMTVWLMDIRPGSFKQNS